MQRRTLLSAVIAAPLAAVAAPLNSTASRNMRPEQLDPNLLEARTLKISILRLMNAYQTQCEIHADDWQFDVYAMVLVLGRRKTRESRQALVELLDFILSDTVSDAISTAVNEDRAAFVPLLKARIGQPLSAEAARKKTYVDAMPLKNRDRQIANWLSELGALK